MKKKTLKFAYWMNFSADTGGKFDWGACYYFTYKNPDGFKVKTQIGANEALAKGYLLDPKTPTLEQWLKNDPTQGKRKITF